MECVTNKDIVIENEQLRLVVGSDCLVKSLICKATGEECAEAGEEIALVSVPAAGTGTPVQQTEAEIIEDDLTPKAAPAEVIIADAPAPKAAPATGAWALINLICMIGTALISILLLLFYFIGKRKEDDEDENEEGEELRRKGLTRLLSLIPAIAGILLFFLTENMSLPMILVDKWTILMVVILLVNMVLALLSTKKREEEENEEAAEMA